MDSCGTHERTNPSKDIRNNKLRNTESNHLRWISLPISVILALFTYMLIPSESVGEMGEVIGGLSHAGRAVVAVAVLMATLWVTEALPIAVTALLPIVLFPLCTGGAVTVKSATAPYAHELIFLFMGGFMISLAMQLSIIKR